MVHLEFLSLVSQKKGTAGRLMESKQDCHKKGCDEKNNKDHTRNILLLSF